MLLVNTVAICLGMAIALSVRRAVEDVDADYLGVLELKTLEEGEDAVGVVEVVMNYIMR